MSHWSPFLNVKRIAVDEDDGDHLLYETEYLCMVIFRPTAIEVTGNDYVEIYAKNHGDVEHDITFFRCDGGAPIDSKDDGSWSGMVIVPSGVEIRSNSFEDDSIEGYLYVYEMAAE